MKDLALELAEIVEEYETLSASETSGSGTTSAPVLARRLPRWTWATIGAGVIVVGLLVGLATRGLLGRGRGAAAEPGQRMQITRLTSGGVTRLAEISPDGRYLARMTYERDGYALRVTQVATGSDVLIVPATKTPFLGFKFTPDGEYLYFTRQEPNVLYASLHRVPILGGASPKLLHDVDCGVGFSPDGKRLAFIRGIPERNESALVLADAEGGDEIVLSLLGNNLDWQQSDPSWSPDGRRIVAARYDVRYPYEVQINVVEVDGGRLRPLGESWSNVVALAWHPDGRTVLVAGSRDQATHSNQLWAVSYPDGKVARITNDLSNYISVSLSKDGRSLVTVQSQTVADIWAAPVGDRQGVRALATAAQLKGHPHQITSSLPGAVLATVSDAHSTRIVSLPEGDGSPRVLYSSPDGIECLRQARSAGTIAFTVVRAGGFNCIWRMDADGGNPTQVTKGGDEWLGDISADGQRIWYCRAQQRGVWEVPAAGGESVQCGDSTLVGMPRLSPDGRFLVCVAIMFMNPGQIQARLELIPVDGGEPAWSRPWSVEEVGDISWTPDGTSISYCVNTGAVGNVWRLSLDGGPPEQVTDFEQDQLFGHAWSADGRTLFVKRGQRLSEAVLIQNYQ
jgi:Tol biopolymer transport system component